jgi:hypothetical protein
MEPPFEDAKREGRGSRCWNYIELTFEEQVLIWNFDKNINWFSTPDGREIIST